MISRGPKGPGLGRAVLHTRGMALLALGRVHDARDQFFAAFTVCAEEGNKRAAARALIGLACTSNALGMHDSCITLLAAEQRWSPLGDADFHLRQLMPFEKAELPVVHFLEGAVWRQLRRRVWTPTSSTCASNWVSATALKSLPGLPRAHSASRHGSYYSNSVLANCEPASMSTRITAASLLGPTAAASYAARICSMASSIRPCRRSA